MFIHRCTYEHASAHCGNHKFMPWRQVASIPTGLALSSLAACLYSFSLAMRTLAPSKSNILTCLINPNYISNSFRIALVKPLKLMVFFFAVLSLTYTTLPGLSIESNTVFKIYSSWPLFLSFLIPVVMVFIWDPVRFTCFSLLSPTGPPFTSSFIWFHFLKM